jgi:hypothetical protein
MKSGAGHWFAAALLVLLIWLLLIPSSQPLWKRPDPPDAQGWKNLHRIGAALHLYQQQNQGELPKRLSELVPDYVPLTNVSWFFPSYDRDFRKMAELRPDIARRLIDDCGAYAYLQKRGWDQDIVAYVRTNIWLAPGFSTPFGDDGVNVLRTGMNVGRIKRGVFLQRFTSITNRVADGAQ